MSSAHVQASPLPIALCITELEPGGAERCLVEIALRLDRARFSPEVVSLAPRPQAGRDGLVLRLEEAGVPTVFMDASGATPWAAWKTCRKLAAHWRERKPQVVQAFLLHANVLATRAARAAGVPHVATGVRVSERRGGWRLGLERYAGRWADCHVCVSESVAEFCRTVTRLDPAKIRVIPNGVDLARFESVMPADLASCGVPAGRKTVLFVGRLEPQKGLDWLLETATRWLPELPQHDLVLVGRGPADASLRAQAAGLGILGRVHFAGWRADVPQLLAASDLLVLPSLWEGMPNVVLEAMAAGRAVVSTEVDGVRELLGDLAELSLVPVRDPQLFAQRIVRILSEPAVGEKLGAGLRQRVERNFSMDSMIRRYEGLYLELATKAHGAK